MEGTEKNPNDLIYRNLGKSIVISVFDLRQEEKCKQPSSEQILYAVRKRVGRSRWRRCRKQLAKQLECSSHFADSSHPQYSR